MKYKVYNQKGENAGTILLPKEVFEVEMNNDLVHQVVVSQTANRRKVIANTKDRKQVSGGGRKPWRQKGTGRARHGSIRSPIWKGGGVTFGPTKQRVFKKKIPQKMKRKSLFMVLSAKAKNKSLFVLDKLTIEKPKTKQAVGLIKDLRANIKDFKTGTILITLPKNDKSIILSVRNMVRVEVKQAKDLNALDLLSFKYLIMPKESVKVIKETFIK